MHNKKKKTDNWREKWERNSKVSSNFQWMANWMAQNGSTKFRVSYENNGKTIDFIAF